ncbi:MAG: multiheme c-type cytochrome [candidate division Zixibacteria bacterium]|nr:multiheme c-type cytochrome [candidate division Zixibacteria bacterium]
MFKKTLPAFIVICLLFFFVGMTLAQETAKEEKKVKYSYVGEAKCKICHKKDNTHPTWAETKHAKAWESLKPEDQKKEECTACHSTGKDADGVLLTGVQCEVCHGPGSEYRKKSIMENRELAIANGLLIPDEKTCLKCHNEKVPEEFRSKEPFDYAKMKTKGVHAIAAKEEVKKEAESK